ncbi:tail fiber assembly protein, partial [Pseudodesulfovibrio pelocollis]|uniref:tail fiber assembly protein n=1 Tax=Pseudodesulfovibrio pelocollis TaxID=3051432 RepID=UPI00255B2452
AERDRLLAGCDWTQLADVPLDALAIGLWADYRQALRDLPGQAGFPGSVEWPERP